MVLVDTSVWIDHFRNNSRQLSELLEQEATLMHPFVLGELACGNFKNRTEILSLLQALPSCARAEDQEVLHFIEQNELMGRGIGRVDMHLLAASRLCRCVLWTRDRKLRAVAEALDTAFQQ